MFAALKPMGHPLKVMEATEDKGGSSTEFGAGASLLRTPFDRSALPCAALVQWGPLVRSIFTCGISQQDNKSYFTIIASSSILQTRGKFSK